MSKRIRYAKQPDGTMLSNYSYRVLGNKLVNVKLNPKELTFEVVDKQGEVLASGNAISDIMLKRKAKDSLVTLGVSFDDETRMTEAQVNILKDEGINL